MPGTSARESITAGTVIPSTSWEVLGLLASWGEPDGPFLWVRARDQSGSGPEVVLQLLSPSTSAAAVTAVTEYVDRAMRRIRKPAVLLPERLLRDEGSFPLAVVYPSIFSADETDPQGIMAGVAEVNSNRFSQLEARWFTVAEALHALHTVGLLHGFVQPRWLVNDGRRLRFMGLGYAPLIVSGDVAARALCSDTAREWEGAGGASVAADVRGFALLVAHDEPRLAATNWYGRATNPDPSGRFERVRDAYEALAALLPDWQSQFGEPPHPRPPGNESDGSIQLRAGIYAAKEERLTGTKQVARPMGQEIGAVSDVTSNGEQFGRDEAHVVAPEHASPWFVGSELVLFPPGTRRQYIRLWNISDVPQEYTPVDQVGSKLHVRAFGVPLRLKPAGLRLRVDPGNALTLLVERTDAEAASDPAYPTPAAGPGWQQVYWRAFMPGGELAVLVGPDNGASNDAASLPIAPYTLHLRTRGGLESKLLVQEGGSLPIHAEGVPAEFAAAISAGGVLDAALVASGGTLRQPCVVARAWHRNASSRTVPATLVVTISHDRGCVAELILEHARLVQWQFAWH